VKKTTYADGGTRIETYYRDGQACPPDRDSEIHGTGTALNTFLIIASVVTACASAS
jgi:hypothetical protein